MEQDIQPNLKQDTSEDKEESHKNNEPKAEDMKPKIEYKISAPDRTLLEDWSHF